MTENVRSDTEFIADPTGHVFAVLDDRELAAQVVARLTDGHFEEVRIYVDSTGERAIDAKGEEHGLVEQAVRTVQQAVANKDNLAEYEQAVADGAAVISLLAPDDRRDEAVAILEAAGAHTINFFGAAVVHTLKP